MVVFAIAKGEKLNLRSPACVGAISIPISTPPKKFHSSQTMYLSTRRESLAVLVRYQDVINNSVYIEA